MSHAILKKLKEASSDVNDLIKQALTAANEAIYEGEKGSEDNSQMACVLTLALVDPGKNKFYYAHVGDTRLYLLRDGSLVKITKDHSLLQEQLDRKGNVFQHYFADEMSRYHFQAAWLCFYHQDLLQRYPSDCRY